MEMEQRPTITLTLEQAEDLMGAFPSSSPLYPKWRDRSVIRVTNGALSHGYGLPLKAESTRFSVIEGDGIIIVEVPEGSSVRAPYGTTFSFDGLGWADETDYRYDTPAWHSKVSEMEADALVPKLRAFLLSLPSDVRDKVEIVLSFQGLGVYATDAFKEGQMLQAGDSDIRIAIHATAFIRWDTTQVADDLGTTFMGPSWLRREMEEKFPHASIEERAAVAITVATRATPAAPGWILRPNPHAQRAGHVTIPIS